MIRSRRHTYKKKKKEDIRGKTEIIPRFHFCITAINSKRQSSFLFSFKVELMLLLAILNGLKSF